MLPRHGNMGCAANSWEKWWNSSQNNHFQSCTGLFRSVSHYLNVSANWKTSANVPAQNVCMETLISLSGIQSFKVRNQFQVLKCSHGAWWPPQNAAVGEFPDSHFKIRPAVDSRPRLCVYGEVVEVRLLLCLVCPSRPPTSFAGRSSSWARGGVDQARLQCHCSSPPLVLTAHWPTGRTDPNEMWLITTEHKTKSNTEVLFSMFTKSYCLNTQNVWSKKGTTDQCQLVSVVL